MLLIQTLVLFAGVYRSVGLGSDQPDAAPSTRGHYGLLWACYASHLVEVTTAGLLKMDENWEHTFRRRMRELELVRPPSSGEIAISIKIGVASGCFHREHSPQAYALIDEKLAALDVRSREFGFEEHESGPEILVYLSLAAAGLSLASNVVNLILTILKARSEGIQRGDQDRGPLRLKVRRVRNAGPFEEEVVLELESHDPVDEARITERLADAVAKLLADDDAGHI